MTDEAHAHGHGATAADRRTTDLTLARLHLRIGSLAMARSEFEGLAGRGPLDDAALVDLAEVRWRMGDTIPAGEAATTALEHGVESPIALMIVAEAAIAIGRPGEARRLATRAMSAAGGTLDALFAGMPRSAVWPSDPADPAPLAATLFGEDRAATDTSPTARSSDRRATDVPGAAVAGVAGSATGAAGLTTGFAGDDSTGPGLWDADGATDVRPAPLRPAELMDGGLAALVAGDTDRAAVLLGLAVRGGPHLGPAILDGTIDVTQPALLLVRGDAFRAVGSESDANATYAAAARAIAAAEAAQIVTPLDGSVVDAALQSGPTTSPSQ